MSAPVLKRSEVPHLQKLRKHDFQLAFLVLLTLRAVKPASRWEKRLGPELASAITRLGLALKSVTRWALNGNEVVETVFSLDPNLVDRYASRFDGRVLDKSPETIRAKGSFFGYPACCVDAFLRAPYAANDLARDDQAILFHWACAGCSETPALLERYVVLHNLLKRL